MLRHIRLTNFRKFDAYSIPLKGGNIFVGPNNAGKSAVIDAIRIVDSCFRYARLRVPQVLQLDGGEVFDGHLIPENRIPVNLSHSTHNYNEDDAVLEFTHVNGARAVVLINPERPVRFYIDADGRRLNSVSHFAGAFPIHFLIVPTLAPLEQEERWVEDETIRRSEASRTASRHLRNVWFRKTQAEFAEFSADIAHAWPGIIVQQPERQRGNQAMLEMFYDENRIAREIQWSGFGFQVWLQLLTHLRRAMPHSIVVVDEPDIYLHPDIQKKLLRFVRDRYEQFIFATHSVEIINEADPLEIISVNSNYRSAKRITSEEDYNRIYSYVGSSQNVDFARVAKSRRVIFVEGDDRRLFQILARRLGLENLAIGAVPFIKLGGFEGWERALNAVWAFREILDIDIEVFCLFDKDYRPSSEIAAFEQRLREAGLRCHVLERKEIENYLLEVRPLLEAVKRRARDRQREQPTDNIIEGWLNEATASVKHRVVSRLSARHVEYSRTVGDRRDMATVNEETQREFELLWERLQDRFNIVPGKEVLSRFNEILQRENVGGLTHRMIVDSMGRDDIDQNFRAILEEINDFCSHPH
ncbi:ATP-binding protein [Mesorhizobium sp.]|uniref:ATP-dependent nuclease n=1 Tax=Mesorhizobium sp. TaxID=1871066 RepID=UPI000FEA7702|nr:ATP-binding protein [Mesorhizobium sp.]RWP72503.1 MAG: hypothetical protein EOR09_20905 [Mesorhizobium sp.]